MTSQEQEKVLVLNCNSDISEIKSQLKLIHSNPIYQSVLKKGRLQYIGKAIKELENATTILQTVYLSHPHTSILDFQRYKNEGVSLDELIKLDEEQKFNSIEELRDLISLPEAPIPSVVIAKYTKECPTDFGDLIEGDIHIIQIFNYDDIFYEVRIPRFDKSVYYTPSQFKQTWEISDLKVTEEKKLELIGKLTNLLGEEDTDE